MPNRAVKMDDSQYRLAGLDEDLDTEAEGVAQTATDTAREHWAEGSGEAMAAEPLVGEEAMVRAFAQLRAAVRDAALEAPPEQPLPAVPPGPVGPLADGTGRQGAAETPDSASPDVLQAGPTPPREDSLFSFQPGSGTVFVSGGAGWADVVRLAGVEGPPGGEDWHLYLEAGTATEVDGAILLSEDVVGSVRLADGSELFFEGVERIEW